MARSFTAAPFANHRMRANFANKCHAYTPSRRGLDYLCLLHFNYKISLSSIWLDVVFSVFIHFHAFRFVFIILCVCIFLSLFRRCFVLFSDWFFLFCTPHIFTYQLRGVQVHRNRNIKSRRKLSKAQKDERFSFLFFAPSLFVRSLYNQNPLGCRSLSLFTLSFKCETKMKKNPKLKLNRRRNLLWIGGIVGLQ